MNANFTLKHFFFFSFLLPTVFLSAQITYPLANECSGEALQYGDEANLLSMLGESLVFYNQSNDNDRSVWLTDGTASGTEMVRQSTSEDDLSLLLRADDRWYFRENRGDSLLISELLIGGDTLIPVFVAPEDARIGSIVLWNGSFYFEQKIGSFGDETLERYELSSGTTTSLFTSDFGGIRGVGTLNDYVMIVTNTETGKKLVRTDGTIAGTEEVFHLYDSGSSFSNSLRMRSNGEKLYFFYHPNNNPRNLWVTDGTSDGTQLLKGYDSFQNTLPPGNATFLGDKYIFVAREDDAPSGTTFELHATDGTPSGTVLLNTGEGYLNPRLLTPFNDKLYFSSLQPGNWGIYSTDGTPAGTSSEIPAYGDIRNMFHIATFQDSLVFGGNESDTGQELYISDGTPEGSRLLSDIIPGEDSSSPFDFIDAGDRLFFLTAPTSPVREIWIYDPVATTTPGNAMVLADSTIVDFEFMNPGSASFTIEGGTPPYLYSLNNGPNLQSSSFEGLEPGDYELLVTDAFGCTLTIDFTIDEIVSTNELAELVSNFVLFPNPATDADHVRLRLSTTEALQQPTVVILNNNGQIVEQIAIPAGSRWEIPVELKSLPSGNYLISIQEAGHILRSEILVR